MITQRQFLAFFIFFSFGLNASSFSNENLIYNLDESHSLFAVSEITDELADLEILIMNTICYDNGTPFDQSDDFFTYEIVVSGLCKGSGWTTNDNEGYTGNYNVVETIGPYPATAGLLLVTVVDNDNVDCAATFEAFTDPCSESCFIDISTPIFTCNDNGTPIDYYDDTFTFDVTINGNNVDGSWIANDINATTGSYNESATFGPYDLVGFDPDITISDTDISFCKEDVDLSSLGSSCNVYKLVFNIFNDYNENGIQDLLEPGNYDSEILISEINQQYYHLPNMNNSVLLPSGTFNVKGNSIAPNAVFTTPQDVQVTLDENNQCVNISFGILPEAKIQSESYIIRRNLGCNTNSTLEIIARNSGTRNIDEGYLYFEIDSASPVISYDIDPDTVVSENIVGWRFTDLEPHRTVSRTIELEIPGPPTTPLGTEFIYHTSAVVLIANDILLGGSGDSWKYSLACSYDPNDKRVVPFHELGYTNIETENLVYTINFQNTGNIPANRVVLTDQISDDLNIETFRFIASSHSENLHITQLENNLLEFRFENINLPDSISDPEGSQGYVMFSLALNESLEEGTEILNEAQIFFDTNPPITTNTTSNKLYFDLDEDGFFSIEDCNDLDSLIYPGATEILDNGIDEDCNGEDLTGTDDIENNLVTFYPNPTNGKVQFEIEHSIVEWLYVYSISGQEMLKLQPNSGRFEIDLSNLNTGVYLIKGFVKDSANVFTLKLIKT